VPNGFQSTMLRPDFVRRVTPPTDTRQATTPDVPRSHFPIVAYWLFWVDRISGKDFIDFVPNAMAAMVCVSIHVDFN